MSGASLTKPGKKPLYSIALRSVSGVSSAVICSVISINIPENKIELKVDEVVLNERMKNFVPKKKELSGYLKRYAALVSSGASGAILN